MILQVYTLPLLIQIGLKRKIMNMPTYTHLGMIHDVVYYSGTGDIRMLLTIIPSYRTWTNGHESTYPPLKWIKNTHPPFTFTFYWMPPTHSGQEYQCLLPTHTGHEHISDCQPAHTFGIGHHTLVNAERYAIPSWINKFYNWLGLMDTLYNRNYNTFTAYCIQPYDILHAAGNFFTSQRLSSSCMIICHRTIVRGKSTV